MNGLLLLLLLNNFVTIVRLIDNWLDDPVTTTKGKLIFGVTLPGAIVWGWNWLGDSVGLALGVAVGAELGDSVGLLCLGIS
jgi:hypothetical protein